MPASLRVKVEAMRAGLPTSKKLLRPTFQGPWTNLGSIWLIWGEWLVKSHLETECVSQKEVFNDSALTYSVSWTDPNSSNSKNYQHGAYLRFEGLSSDPLHIDVMQFVMQCRLSKWLQVELFSSFYSLGAGSCFDSLLRSWPISSLQNPSCFSFFLPFCPSLLLYPPWKLVNLQTRLCFPFFVFSLSWRSGFSNIY